MVALADREGADDPRVIATRQHGALDLRTFDGAQRAAESDEMTLWLNEGGERIPYLLTGGDVDLALDAIAYHLGEQVGSALGGRSAPGRAPTRTPNTGTTRQPVKPKTIKGGGSRR